MPKAVMFDCYNTLLYYRSDEEKDGIWEMMLGAVEYITEKQFPITPDELESLYQEVLNKKEMNWKHERGEYAENSLCEVWAEVLESLQIPQKVAEEKSEDILLLYRLLTRKEKHVFANAQEELKKLKQRGMKILLLSNAQNCFIYNELPQEIRDLFDEILISESLGIKKPSPDVFRMALERLGLRPEETVFVGDSAEDDMIPAGKLGCHCIMIGRHDKMEPIPAHAIPFDPHKESGYSGLADVILTLEQ